MATALSRFSTPASSGSSRSSSSSSQSRSALVSAGDLGSTASNLPGGANGPPSAGQGGGGDDWHVILQTVAAAGSQVRKGQVLAEFDRQYQLLRLEDFRAALNDMDAGLKALRETLDVEKRAHATSIAAAESALEKARYDLKTIPVQSAIVSEKLKLAEQEAAAVYKEILSEVKQKGLSQEAEWRRNQLERDQSKIELGRAEANADRMLVRSRIDGTVVMSNTFRGGEFAQIRAGDELHPGMMFMRVVDPSSMIINAAVNQADIEQIRVGTEAQVRFDAYPDLVLPARIHAIGAMPKTGGFRASYVKEVPVVLKLEKLDPRVIPDLSVSVDVLLGSAPDATVAPLEAVFHGPGDQPFVLVQAAGRWERREVEVGLANNTAAVIRRGLDPGDVIAADRPPEEKK